MLACGLSISSVNSKRDHSLTGFWYLLHFFPPVTERSKANKKKNGLILYQVQCTLYPSFLNSNVMWAQGLTEVAGSIWLSEGLLPLSSLHWVIEYLAF